MNTQKGSSGDIVVKIQKQLGITADGVFGDLTEQAVTRFQLEHNLTVDGIVGPTTWKALSNQSHQSTLIPDESQVLIERLTNYIQQSLLTQLPDVMSRYRINTPSRLAHFLGQCHHESAGFTKFHENLMYVTESRLRSVFKRCRDLSEVEIERFICNPEGLANFVYADKYGNGDEASGDGWKYSGKGAIQLTFKSNYVEFFNSLGLDEDTDPSTVATEYSLISAGFFFHSRDIVHLCDGAVNKTSITKVTKAINPACAGLDNRISRTLTFYNILK